MPSRFALFLIALTVPLFWASLAHGSCPVEPEPEPVLVDAGCAGMACICTSQGEEKAADESHQIMPMHEGCCCTVDPTDSPFSDRFPIRPASGQESQVRVGTPIEVIIKFPPFRVVCAGVVGTGLVMRPDGFAGGVLCVLRL